MKTSTLLLILASVALSAVAQIALRKGMTGADVQRAFTAGWLPATVAVGISVWVIVGLALYFVGALVWLVVLSDEPVSIAYPFVGLGFIMTMLLGWGLLGEAMNAQRILGTLLVAAGVVLIARGA